MTRRRKKKWDALAEKLGEVELPPGSVYERYADRIGRDIAVRRRYIEEGLYGPNPPPGFRRRRWKRRAVYFLQKVLLRLSGLHCTGTANTRELELVHHEIELPRLPASFDGFRILHCSDFHLDLNPGVVARALQLLKGVPFDLAVITGDFFDAAPDPGPGLLAAFAEFARVVPGPIHGVPGNHDSLCALEQIEGAGVRLLINEDRILETGVGKIYLAGVDDPHTFQTDDFSRLSAPPSSWEGLRLLLAHAPDCYREAEGLGFDLMLSGHTHGGQICLPGGTPVIGNSAVPRSMIAGTWRWKQLAGRTSRGAGSGKYPVRFNCTPEIGIAVLRSPRTDLPANRPVQLS